MLKNIARKFDNHDTLMKAKNYHSTNILEIWEMEKVRLKFLESKKYLQQIPDFTIFIFYNEMSKNATEQLQKISIQGNIFTSKINIYE